MLPFFLKKHMRIIGIDESGISNQHNNIIKKIQNNQLINTFSNWYLGFLIIERLDYINLIKELTILKKKFFNGETPHLHATELFSKNGSFYKYAKNDVSKFIEEILLLLTKTNFNFYIAKIEEKSHYNKYLLKSLDPYILSISYFVEKYIYDFTSDNTVFILENRSPIRINANKTKISGCDVTTYNKFNTTVNNVLREKKRTFKYLMQFTSKKDKMIVRKTIIEITDLILFIKSRKMENSIKSFDKLNQKINVLNFHEILKKTKMKHNCKQGYDKIIIK